MCVLGHLVAKLCNIEDLLIMGDEEKEIKKLNNHLIVKIPANDLGKATEFLEIKLLKDMDT